MHVHLDLIGGIAGDMFLAAALDAGLIDDDGVAELEQALSSLGVGDIRIERERVRRGAIAGTHIEFAGWPPEAESDHRHLSTILEMLEDAELPDAVHRRAVSMFKALGESESQVHDLPLEDVHFHECGALDSIFDFVSAAWILETTADSWSFGDIPTGRGTAQTDHGAMPIPVPATTRLLRGLSTAPSDIEAEMVTPTGATILRAMADISPENRRPSGTIQTDGFGAGTRDLEAVSNVVRLMVIEADGVATESAAPEEHTDFVVSLTCEIDDMTPELLADTEEALLEDGAIDVVREPVTMKKGRQGTRLSVLSAPEDAERLAESILRHTTTFGVRMQTVERRILQRGVRHVQTQYGDVPIKVGAWRGEILQRTPEYEVCRQLAREHGVPTRKVYRAAQSAADASTDNDSTNA
jgi:hypothetical protein